MQAEREDFHKDRFVFLAALPKSASSLVWLIASSLLEENGRANPARMQGLPPSPFMPLHTDVLNLFPEGGVYKSHAPLTFDTAHFLQEVRCKYIVLLRHPADFIASLYCHTRGTEAAGRRSAERTGRPQSTWTYALSAMRRDVFSPQVPVDKAIRHLIKDGALHSAVDWMGAWTTYRDRKQSLVISYESLLEQFDQTVAAMSDFIAARPPTDDVMHYLRQVKAAVTAEGKLKQANYPFGWTGRVGVWRQYFSEENRCLFEDMMRKLLSCFPHAEALSARYPELPYLPRGTPDIPH